MAGTVVVACKLPHGIKIPASKKNPEITLAGAYTHQSFREDKGLIAPGAFGLTTVDADAWNAASEVYADWKPIKSGLIFAQKNAASVKAEAKEKTDEKTGLEQVEQPSGKDGVKVVDPTTGKAK